MEGVACFFSEQKASKFASHGSGNLGLTCTCFPVLASFWDGMSMMGLPGQAVCLKKKK